MVNVAPPVPHTPGSWRLIYDAPTRGEQIRILLARWSAIHGRARSSIPEGLNPYKRAAMGDDSPLLGTEQCPAVTAPDVPTASRLPKSCASSEDRWDWHRRGTTADTKAMEMTMSHKSYQRRLLSPG